MKDNYLHLIKNNVYSIVLHLIVILLSFEVYYLSMQNQNVKDLFAKQNRKSIEVGDTLKYLEVSDLDKNILKVQSTDDYILTLFTTTCPHCKRNINAWNMIDSAINQRSESMKMKGICLSQMEDSKAFLEQNKLTYSTFVAINSEKFNSQNRINNVPLTLKVSPNGVIKQMWVGALNDKMVNEVIASASQETSNQ